MSASRLRLCTGISALLLVGALVTTSRLSAGTCTVPGSHGTIQEAVDDTGCSTIELAAQVYEESVSIDRNLTLQGASGGGSTIEGRLLVGGAGSEVSANHLKVDTTTANLAGCFQRALEVNGGARLTGQGLELRNSLEGDCLAAVIFADGFESGDISAWSDSRP